MLCNTVDRPLVSHYGKNHPTAEQKVMQIFLNDYTHGGRKISIYRVKPFDTIRSLMEKIKVETNIPICRQRLVCVGRHLDDPDRLLYEVPITNLSTLQLFIRWYCKCLECSTIKVQ